MSIHLAPVLLFCYNRKDCLERTVKALSANTLAKKSILVVFSDGPKDTEEDKQNVAEVRAFLDSYPFEDYFLSVTINKAKKKNKLAPALITGITESLEIAGKVIVVEDDIETNKFFLQFINDALELYKDCHNVGMIHGHIGYLKGLPSTFFSRRVGCWGWGTWTRAWDEVSFDGKMLLQEIEKQRREQEFDLDGVYPHTQMLRDCVDGKNSSWAIRVYASFFLKNMLTLYPGKALSVHIGFGGGTHYSVGNWTRGDGLLSQGKCKVTKVNVQEDEKIISKFHKGVQRYSDEKEVVFIKNSVKIKINQLRITISKLFRIIKKIIKIFLPYGVVRLVLILKNRGK